MKRLLIIPNLATVIALCLTLASCYTLYPASSPSPGGNTSTAQSQPSGNTSPATTAIPPEPPPLTGTLVPGDTLTEKLAWLQQSADSHNTYILEVTALVYVNGGVLKLRTGSAIIGNDGGGVNLSSGTFDMTGGSISDNSARHGGGVFMSSGVTFTMSGGTVAKNIARENGGGIFVNAGLFTMSGGTVLDNTAAQGGGVSIQNNTGNFTFNMIGGSISGNIASDRGGGVYIGSFSTFTMRGGSITANTANNYGGGLAIIGSNGHFIKTGGIITGYNTDPVNGNVVKVENILARRGHAVFVNENMRKETTAGSEVNLSSNTSGTSGGWDS